MNKFTSVSFIMMCKNNEHYIAAAIEALFNLSNKVLWELIIIDDGSTDRSYDIAKKFSSVDRRVKVFKNPQKGKVLGTNFGFSKSRYEIIKCIDSDDILLPNFSCVLEFHSTHDVVAHASEIVDNELNLLGTYYPNPEWERQSTRYIIQNIVSLPKFSWSFTRELAEKVFPMDPDLPFEDAWIALLLKIHCKKSYFTNTKCYLYRQHKSQTFSGILNFNLEIVCFRAERLLRLVHVLKANERVMGVKGDLDFSSFEAMQNFLAGNLSLFSFLLSRHKLNLKQIFRSILIRYAPSVSSRLIKFKWWLDKVK